MSTPEKLLERLDSVTKRAPGEWMAKCPAHNDRSPSLSISSAEDCVLIHCFAGCGVAEVVSAVGLSLSNLYPSPRSTQTGKLRPRRDFREVLKAIRFEVTIVAIAARHISNGESLSADDLCRVFEAWKRIIKAMEANGV